MGFQVTGKREFSMTYCAFMGPISGVDSRMLLKMRNKCKLLSTYSTFMSTFTSVYEGMRIEV